MEHNDYIFDDRSPSFFQIGDLTKMIAEKHCGLDIDETAHIRWRELMGLLREVDTLADDTALTDDKVLGLLDGYELFKNSYPSLGPEQLPSHRRKKLLARTALILSIGNRITECTDVSEFIRLRINEGEETTNLLADCATEFVDNQPAFYERFIPVMSSLAVTACLLDTASDAKNDYLTGKISIEPTVNFRTQMLKEAAGHIGPGLKSVSHRGVFKQFYLMSVTRLKNRLHHGPVPYSSMHNLK